MERSPFVDQALEKFLNRLRVDFELTALALADENGLLLAASGPMQSELGLSGLGALGADVRFRLKGWPGLSLPARVTVEAPAGEKLVITFIAFGPTRLSLCLLGPAVPDPLIVRAREGVTRILGA